MVSEVEGDQGAAAAPPAPWRGTALALGVVLVIAVSQVTASQLTKTAQAGLQAPFFIMYVHTVEMVLCLPAARCLAPHDVRVCADVRRVARFLVLWVAANYCFVYALKLAPAGLVQTVFGVAPAVVAVLSRVILREPLTVQRMLAVALAVVGVAAVSSRAWSHGVVAIQLLSGSALACVAVFAAATYKVFFKAVLGDPPAFVVLGFVGTIGCVMAAVGAPVTVGLSAAELEDVWWSPSTVVNWWLLLGSGVVDVVYNTAIAYGLAIASPVFVALATILATPLNLLVDAVVRGESPTVAEACGALVIISSFLLLLWETQAAARSTVSSQPPHCLESANA